MNRAAAEGGARSIELKCSAAEVKHMAKGKVEFRPKALVISCRDRHRSAQFYEGVLGAVRLPGEGSDGYGCPWFRLGLWELSLMPNATKGSAWLAPSPCGHHAHAGSG